MSIKYKLTKDVIARTAANLVFELHDIKSIHIVKNNICFNGKSLVGILSNDLRINNIITVEIEDYSDIKKVKEIFSNIGREI